LRNFRLSGWLQLALVASILCPSEATACQLSALPPTTTLRLTPPSDRSIFAQFGMQLHPVLGFNRMHPGIDYDAASGDPVRAAGIGTVVFAGWSGEYGNRVELNHGGGIATTYSNLARFTENLKIGDCVDTGSIIGSAGATGLAARPHLHFELTRHGVWLDPEPSLLPPR
jgi:murein DD-endopeptidase MepM/ murein hydrolase activator NlpD